MVKIIVAGCGTGVGKTIVSAVLIRALNGDYWKPIQCGTDSDAAAIKSLVPLLDHHIHPSTYSLQAPLSPHHAARLEKITINSSLIIPPTTVRHLIIESVGGILVPLNQQELTLDLFSTWDATWIVVSKHYLGSINHTLLTLETLRQRGIKVHSIIFNGFPNHETEKAILGFSQLSCLGRLLPEKKLNPTMIQRYANQWKPHLQELLV